MRYVEAPNTIETEISLFVAGGISNTSNWQKEFIDKLCHLDITIYNPRRKNFSLDNPEVSLEQIKWEYDCLKKADMICFWFSKETICPITLFELGAHLKDDKPIFIGVDPLYSRKLDIEVQVSLVRPSIEIINDLDILAEQIINFLKY